MLEEMYVYFNMPDPAFGIQLVYNHTEYPELVTVVGRRCRTHAHGFHPNVSVPGHPISFSGSWPPPRGRRPAVWCGQRAARIRPGVLRTGSRPEKIASQLAPSPYGPCRCHPGVDLRGGYDEFARRLFPLGYLRSSPLRHHQELHGSPGSGSAKDHAATRPGMERNRLRQPGVCVSGELMP